MPKRKSQQSQAQGTVTEPLLTVSELSAYLKVSTQWIYRHSDLPRVRVGHRIRYSVSAVREHLAKQTLTQQMNG